MANERTHIDLFTGVAGFSLAARANGVRTVVQCEADPKRRAFLERTWGVPVISDVRSFDGREWRGCWLLTSGTPCQPASRAGQQRGAADDRWLWGEALRVVAEAKPRWALFENPPGIDDVGLGGIISQLGRLGYEVGVASIPACAVNSPQDRERYWIIAGPVGNAESGDGRLPNERRNSVPQHDRAVEASPMGNAASKLSGAGRPHRPKTRQESRLAVESRTLASSHGESCDSGPHQPGRGTQGRVAGGGNAAGFPLADSGSARRRQERGSTLTHETEHAGRSEAGDNKLARDDEGHWDGYDWLQCPDKDGYALRRIPTDLYRLADELPHRIPRKLWSPIISALGDSIVWPIAAEIIYAMIKAENETNPR